MVNLHQEEKLIQDLTISSEKLYNSTVLAYPFYEYNEYSISTLKEAGLMGIEAVYSTYASSDERDMRRLADKHNLLISGGSDFHGDNKPKLEMGSGYGKLYIDYSILENIKKRMTS